MKFRICCVVFSSILMITSPTKAQNPQVEINANVTRSVGGVTELDRTKYFNIHVIDKENDPDYQTFYNDYNVSPDVGRAFAGPGYKALTKTGEVGLYPSLSLTEHTDWWSKEEWKIDTISEFAYISNSWKRAAWNKPFNSSVGDSIMIEAILLLDTLSGTGSTILSLGLQDVPGEGIGSVNYCNVYLSSAEDTLRMRNYNNYYLDTVVCFTPLEQVDDDTLAIQIKIQFGSDASTSTVSTRIVNVSDNDSTIWGTYTGINQSVYNAAISTGAYFFMGSAGMTTAGISTIKIKQVSIDGVSSEFSDLGQSSSSPYSVKKFIVTEHNEEIYKEGVNLDSLGDWTVRYFKNYYDSTYMPQFYEPMNEPFVHARDFYDEPDWTYSAEIRVKSEMSQLFREVAKKIHETPELTNIKVSGYTAAYPSYERNNFSNWEGNMKLFLDTAGAEMDAVSIHIYDGINQVGEDTKRSGSNMIAILDLLESYSYSKWGQVKPFLISEFGGIVDAAYSDTSCVQSVKSQNSQIFELFEREDRLGLAIPFNCGKETWYITEANNYLPYKAALFKPINIGVPVNEITGWEYSDLIYFYDLWKEVQGNRVLIKSGNPDIQAQGFLNGNNLFIALNNLEDSSQTVDLDFVEQMPDISWVSKKSLIIYKDQLASYTTDTIYSSPSSITLEEGETVVLRYALTETISPGNHVFSNMYYSDKIIESITASTPIQYTFNNVANAEGTAYATLKMSISRKHDKSKSPIVEINGDTVNVPSNWKGYDQANRDDFFGTIEIPVSPDLIQTNDTVNITFPDDGGQVSTVVLNVETFETWNPDEVTLINVPEVMATDTVLSFAVDYSAKFERKLVVYLNDPNGNWIGAKTVEVIGPGTGIDTLSVSFATAPALGDNYRVFANIRPVGGDWSSNLDSDNRYFDLIADSISFNNPPDSLYSQSVLTFTVNYSATVQRDLNIEIRSPQYNFLGQQRVTVQAGRGIQPISINLGSAPIPGDNYRASASIRPVGGDWTTTINNEILYFDIKAPIVDNGGFEMGDFTSWFTWNNAEIDTSPNSGNYNVKITDMGSVNQLISVQPNTTYTLWCYSKVQPGGFVYLGVKNYGGIELTTSITSSTYAEYSVQFTTGTSDTTAIIYLYVPSNGTTAYGDDFYVSEGTLKSARIKSSLELESIKDDSNILIYPNPVTNDFICVTTSNEFKNAQLKIHDIQGRLIYQKSNINGNETTVQDVDFFQGIYVLSIINEGKVISKKLIVN